MGDEGLILETSHELSGESIDACETDIVAIAYGSRPRPHTHILIGECKGRGTVNSDDIAKLMRASEVIRRTDGVDCDLLFATTRDEFEGDEVELCRNCYEASSDDHWSRRGPILLTRRELESSRFSSRRLDDDPDHVPGAWPGFAQLVEWSTRRYFVPEGVPRITPT